MVKVISISGTQQRPARNCSSRSSPSARNSAQSPHRIERLVLQVSLIAVQAGALQVAAKDPAARTIRFLSELQTPARLSTTRPTQLGAASRNATRALYLPARCAQPSPSAEEDLPCGRRRWSRPLKMFVIAARQVRAGELRLSARWAARSRRKASTLSSVRCGALDVTWWKTITRPTSYAAAAIIDVPWQEDQPNRRRWISRR
ncbi:hypothetical protein [Streptomyces sp. NPDC001139]